MYKQSIYTEIIREFDNGDILLYNTFTNALGVLENKYKDLYLKLDTYHTLNEYSNCEEKNIINILFSGGFIVEKESNEVKKMDYNERLLRYENHEVKALTIAPTLACNMDCPYCYEDKSQCTKISKDVMDRLLEFIYRFTEGCKHFEVTWFGGEPLLALDEVCYLSEKIIKFCDEKNIQYKASIVTNGSLLDKKTAKTLSKYCKVVHAQITIDGTEQIHNIRRKLVDGRNSFAVITQNVENIKGIIPITIRINVDKTNANAIDDLIEYFVKVKKWGKDDDIVFYLGIVEKSTEHCNILDNSCFSHSEFSEILKKYYLKLFDLGCYNAFTKLLTSPKPIHCGAITKNSFVIDSDGDIYKCWNVIGMKEEAIGNLNTGVKLSSKHLDWLLIDLPTQCKSCSFRPQCQGSCPYKRINNDNIPNCGYRTESYRDLLNHIYLSDLKLKSINVGE